MCTLCVSCLLNRGELSLSRYSWCSLSIIIMFVLHFEPRGRRRKKKKKSLKQIIIIIIVIIIIIIIIRFRELLPYLCAKVILLSFSLLLVWESYRHTCVQRSCFFRLHCLGNWLKLLPHLNRKTATTAALVRHAAPPCLWRPLGCCTSYLWEMDHSSWDTSRWDTKSKARLDCHFCTFHPRFRSLDPPWPICRAMLHVPNLAFDFVTRRDLAHVPT